MKSQRAERVFEHVKVNYVTTFLFIVVINKLPVEAQVVSHELRRVTLSSNQFGIDALRVLDKIEPGNKVIVFCPACISSSLMMIMMGSSKSQIVQSISQGLYVSSLKPMEVNRGYRDLFDHLGLNQPVDLKTIQSQNFKRNSSQQDHGGSGDLRRKRSYLMRRSFSLPDLMVLREITDKGQTHKPTSNPPKPPVSGRIENDNPRNISSVEPNKACALCGMTQLTSISNIYIQRGIPMDYNYNLMLRDYYKTVMHPVDFLRNREETRQHINSLVASSTEGKIRDLIPRESMGDPKYPNVMIISAFHLRGTLDIQIKVGPSRSGRSLTTKQIAPAKPYMFIETEKSLMKFGVFPELDCKVVEIPFSNRLISLVIMMANHANSTDLMMMKLSGRTLSDVVNSLEIKKISIEMPVIKFDRGPTNVEGLLRELGLSYIFLGGKSLSSETGLNRWMRPSDIVHETSIDIGTINPRFAQPEDRLKDGAHDSTPSRDTRPLDESTHVKLDKPFLYFVLDSINGLILTMGRIRQ